MTSKLRKRVEALPSWEKRFTTKFLFDVVERMNDVLREKGASQRELAQRAGWTDSYVSRLLSGHQNLTLKTIARFEDAMESDILTVGVTSINRLGSRIENPVKEDALRRAVEDWRDQTLERSKSGKQVGVESLLGPVPRAQRESWAQFFSVVAEELATDKKTTPQGGPSAL